MSSMATIQVVSPYHITDWEKANYYHGLSANPPELLYRSDLQENPFPVPQGRFPLLPLKTIHGVFGTPLNDVWDLVAPQICGLLKSRKIRYSAITTARFSTRDDDGNDKLGPIVIWIATHPSTTTAGNAYDVSPAVLSLLKDNGVEGAVIEWYEGAVEKLCGPPLLRVTPTTDPTHHHRRVLTTALGMPITTNEMEAMDAQGSVSFFFHENKDKNGDTSDRVLAVSNCHVLRNNTKIDHEFKGTDASHQIVRLAGRRRFRRAIDEIKVSTGRLGIDADLLAREIIEMERELETMPPSDVDDAKVALEDKQAKLTKAKTDISALEAFHKELNSQWSDIGHRNIGRVDWAPKISADVNNGRYTLDIGTFELNEARFRPNFAGNIVDLGTKYTPGELTNKFYPRNNSRTVFKYPTQRKLRINGCVTREVLDNPDCFDSDNKPCLVVMKDGNTTDLTVGRYSGTEAYVCDELGIESIELAIYNYEKESGDFAAKGDSGSLVFDGLGRMVGIIHSGIVRDSTLVAFATPAWFVVQKLKTKYPHADLKRQVFKGSEDTHN